MTQEDLLDLIETAIVDSFDVDWRASHGAHAILAAMDAERVVTIQVSDLASEDEADKAIRTLKPIIHAAENSSQHGEDEAVTAYRAVQAAGAMWKRLADQRRAA